MAFMRHPPLEQAHHDIQQEIIPALDSFEGIECLVLPTAFDSHSTNLIVQ